MMSESDTKKRGLRKERVGVVVSNSGLKTIVVEVEIKKQHARYKKEVRQKKKYHAHDENGDAKVGNVVRIVETRPISRMKRWRLTAIVK